MIVPLDKKHREEAATLLAAAFAEDPDVVAIFGGNIPSRRQILRVHYASLIDAFLPFGRSVCATTDGKVVGVMLYIAPGEEPLSAAELLKHLFTMLLRSGPLCLWRGYRSSMDDERHRPKAPHYYLSTLAVDIEHQGEGVGSLLLSHITAIADSEDTLICLTSTNPKAVPLYERFGFNTVLLTSPLGVPNHHMERPPRGKQAG